MCNIDDLNTYNGDNVHDMWVDYDNYQNTGTPDVFDEYNPDDEYDLDNPDNEYDDWD